MQRVEKKGFNNLLFILIGKLIIFFEKSGNGKKLLAVVISSE